MKEFPSLCPEAVLSYQQNGIRYFVKRGLPGHEYKVIGVVDKTGEEFRLVTWANQEGPEIFNLACSAYDLAHPPVVVKDPGPCDCSQCGGTHVVVSFSGQVSPCDYCPCGG